MYLRYQIIQEIFSWLSGKVILTVNIFESPEEDANVELTRVVNSGRLLEII